MEEYLEIRMGSSFLLNAGICGLVKLLEIQEAELEIDYILKEQSILLSKNYIETHDLADYFIKSMVAHFQEDTKYIHLLNKRGIVDALHKNMVEEGREELNKKELESLNAIYKEMIQMLEKNSFKAGYVILQDKYEEFGCISDLIISFKKEKEQSKKRDYYYEVCNILMDDRIKEVLIMKELMYSKINLFYENTSFFLPANLKKDIKAVYEKDFVQPLLEELKGKKQAKKRCIECTNMVSSAKAISFMIDTTDDINRKKSHYWNQKPDAVVCPICAFLYTLVPIGFYFSGSDAVFINNNSNLNLMIRMMNNYQYKFETDDKKAIKSKLFRVFTSEGIEMSLKKLFNIQVIVRKQMNSHFEMTIIGRDMVEGLKNGSKNLQYLEKKFVKIDGNFISVYDETLTNILQKRTQYPTIHKLLQHELRSNGNTNYLMNLLELQIIFQGGGYMSDLYKQAKDAWSVGISLREHLKVKRKGQDIDNYLRGIIYKLSNTLAVKNREQFMDSIIRIYSGEGLPIPFIFRECFQSDEALVGIGHGFILGLKYVKYNSEAEK